MSLYFSIHIFSFRNSSRWPTNIINSVDKIKWSALAKAYKLILFGVKDTVDAKKIQNKRQNGENVENNRLMKRCFIVTCLVSSTPRRNVFRCENIFIQTRGICYWKLKQRLLGLCIKHSYPPPGFPLFLTRILSHFHRRLILSLLSIFYCREVTEDENYKYSSSGSYFAPPEVSVSSLRDKITILYMTHQC